MCYSDQGDNTYQNPILLCDYSDPDVIRVGDTYYMTASSFNYVPGLPILTSHDLVNWTLVNYALPNIPERRFDVPQHAQGVWAPAIRWHDGRFWIYYGMPDEGIFMVSAEDPLGVWEAPVCVLAGRGLIDPCPFWDADGTAWIVHGYAKSRIGFKSVLGMFPISADGKRAIGEDHIIFDGRQSQPTIEGPKVYRRSDWLYIFAPAGGVHNGWQTVLRAREIRGKWEDRIVMRQGSTSVNGPHQGAWVTTPDGQDWFLHFQSRGAYGRVVHLQPMNWMEDGWPVIGQQDPHPEAPAAIYTGDNLAAITCQSDMPYGVPVQQYNKPHAPACERVVQEMKDGFCGTLGLQWQFMANWRPEFFTVGGSSLTLHACALPDGAETLWSCPQVLSQKIAALSFTAQVAVDASELRSWEQAGVCILGGAYAYAALRRTDDGLWLVWAEGEQRQEGMVEHTDCAIPVPEQLVLRLAVRAIDLMTVEAVWAWSSDGNDWHVIGEPFSPGRHTWVGARVGLFCMPTDGSEHGGSAKFGPFLVE